MLIALFAPSASSTELRSPKLSFETLQFVLLSGIFVSHFDSIYLALHVLRLLHRNMELVRARSSLKAHGFSFVKQSS